MRRLQRHTTIRKVRRDGRLLYRPSSSFITLDGLLLACASNTHTHTHPYSHVHQKAMSVLLADLRCLYCLFCGLLVDLSLWLPSYGPSRFSLTTPRLSLPLLPHSLHTMSPTAARLPPSLSLALSLSLCVCRLYSTTDAARQLREAWHTPGRPSHTHTHTHTRDFQR